MDHFSMKMSLFTRMISDKPLIDPFGLNDVFNYEITSNYSSKNKKDTVYRVLYIMGYDDVSNKARPYKIGKAKDSADERRKKLQTGNERKLVVKAEFKSDADVSRAERIIHNELLDKKIKGGGNEWYMLTDSDVRSLIKKYGMKQRK